MITFYSTTTLKNKYQVKSTEEMSGKGITKIGSDTIHTHKGKIYKDLHNYWVSQDALNVIKSLHNPALTSF